MKNHVKFGCDVTKKLTHLSIYYLNILGKFETMSCNITEPKCLMNCTEKHFVKIISKIPEAIFYEHVSEKKVRKQ